LLLKLLPQKEKAEQKLAKKPKFSLESLAMKFVFFMAIFLSSALHAEESQKAAKFTICKNRSDVRTISIQKSAAGYETIYSKFGSPKVIGSGWSLESNANFLNNVKANLEKSGFDCRDVNEASIQGEKN